MIKLSNSTVILFERLLQQRGAQVFGSWFQDAVAAALDGIPAYRGCFANRGAGQPDIKAGDTGFEVKSTAAGAIDLDTNYRAIRGQFAHFRLVAMRTDVRPYHLWVIGLPADPPHRVALERAMDTQTPLDEALGADLTRRLAAVVTAAGTSWTDAPDRDAACAALKGACAALERAPAREH
ncbi:MAG: hypothetical protein RIT24_1904 [Planctomycetota bacterium]|jgi:hypothetical protein